MSRDKTPNLMDELTGAVKAQKQQRPKTAVAQDDEKGKRKVTYYISDDVLALLEDAWIAERQQAKRDAREPLSKSQMVEQAIRQYLIKRP
jgi:hypothetical protein